MQVIKQGELFPSRDRRTYKTTKERQIEYSLGAKLMQEYSHNPKVQTGAIIVSKKTVVGKGSNSTAGERERDSDDYALLSMDNPDNSYRLNMLEHAERNAIMDAVRKGNWRKLPGSSIYVAYLPCVPCSNAIINAGIKEVIDSGTRDMRPDSKWYNDWVFVTEKLYPKAGIKLIKIEIPQSIEDKFNQDLDYRMYIENIVNNRVKER